MRKEREVSREQEVRNPWSDDISKREGIRESDQHQPCLPFLPRDPLRASLSQRCASNRPVHRCLRARRPVTASHHTPSASGKGTARTGRRVAGRPAPPPRGCLPCDAAVRGAALRGALPRPALPPRPLRRRLCPAGARGGAGIPVGSGVPAGPCHWRDGASEGERCRRVARAGWPVRREVRAPTPGGFLKAR